MKTAMRQAFGLGIDPKRAILALLLVNMVLVTAGEVKNRQMPRPSRYVALALVFFTLLILSEFGRSFGKFAIAFAGLLTLVIAISKSSVLVSGHHREQVTATAGYAGYPTANRIEPNSATAAAGGRV